MRWYSSSVPASTPGTARRARKPNRCALSRGERCDSRSARKPAPVGSAPRPLRAARRISVGVAANTARTVSLNCRMLAKPEANATSANGRSDVCTRVRAAVRPLRPGQGERPRADLVDEQAVQVAAAVPEPRRQALDARPVDLAVGDEAHGPGHHVGAVVPLRRAGHGVGSAALARAEPGRLGRGRGGVEAHVAPLGHHGRAAGPAVDAGGRDGHVEPPVEAGIAPVEAFVADVGIEQHPCIVTRREARCWRESDITVGGRGVCSGSLTTVYRSACGDQRRPAGQARPTELLDAPRRGRRHRGGPRGGRRLVDRTVPRPVQGQFAPERRERPPTPPSPGPRPGRDG